MLEKKLLQRVNLLTNKLNVEEITENNIMNLMETLHLSFDEIIHMPIYTYNKFIKYLNDKNQTKTIGGQVITLVGEEIDS